MNNIPSVDLRDFLSNNLEKKERFVQTIGGAFQEIGFCAVRGHFLSDELVPAAKVSTVKKKNMKRVNSFLIIII